MRLNKVDKIFIILIILELITLLIINFFLSPVWYPTPCHARDYSLLDPFNFFKYKGVCIQILARGINPLFYPVADLLILTIIAYITYLIIRKTKSINQKPFKQ